jgi:starch-binding outer membrane protein, SusD/RagB family
MELINMLRKKRIKADAYADESAVTQEEAIEKVLAERRREMAFSGQRWMDMKRLDADDRMPEVKRLNFETMVEDATLPPHSDAYTFEIPSRVLLFNPQMTKNH